MSRVQAKGDIVEQPGVSFFFFFNLFRLLKGRQQCQSFSPASRRRTTAVDGKMVGTGSSVSLSKASLY